MSKRLPREQQLTSANWFGKASAGTVAGFLLTLAICGLFASVGPGEVGFFSARAQLTMWLMAPMWALILSFCFLFRNGPRAWFWLTGANVITWTLLYVTSGIAG